MNIAGCEVFSTIDFVKAYQQIPANPDDICKIAITTPFGLYEFPYMTFGLMNTTSIFVLRLYRRRLNLFTVKSRTSTAPKASIQTVNPVRFSHQSQ